MTGKISTFVQPRKTGPKTAQATGMMKRRISETDRRKDAHTEGKAAGRKGGRHPGGNMCHGNQGKKGHKKERVTRSKLAKWLNQRGAVHRSLELPTRQGALAKSSFCGMAGPEANLQEGTGEEDKSQQAARRNDGEGSGHDDTQPLSSSQNKLHGSRRETSPIPLT